MERRKFLQTTAAGLLSSRLLNGLPAAGGDSAHPGSIAKEAGRLFPANLKDAKWQEFQASGYSNPVTGIIYRNRPGWTYFAFEERPRPVSGVPVGSIDTGGVYLEGDGTFGYISIFNNYVPPGGPLNTPFLGIGIRGQTHVLTTGQTKNYAGNSRP